jgi:hypothetical protein
LGTGTARDSGQSGNPKGRPKGDPAFRQRCEEFMTDEDWAHLTAIARHRKHRDCFNALKFIAEKRYGKAAAQVEVNFFKQPTFTVVREINGRRTTIEEELPFIEHED